MPEIYRDPLTPLFERYHTRELTMDLLTRDSKALSLLGCVLFVVLLIPLTVGGKVYNSMRAIMTFKLIVVMGFLVFLAVFYSKADTWWEIGSGFVKFGNVPVIPDEDVNENGKRDEGEAPHRPKVENIFSSWMEGRLYPRFDLSMVATLVAMIYHISGNSVQPTRPSVISRVNRVGVWDTTCARFRASLAGIPLNFPMSAWCSR